MGTVLSRFIMLLGVLLLVIAAEETIRHVKRGR